LSNIYTVIRSVLLLTRHVWRFLSFLPSLLAYLYFFITAQIKGSKSTRLAEGLCVQEVEVILKCVQQG